MPTDLVIVGDSHTAALAEGAAQLGYDPKLLYISGNHWHENKMRAHPQLGLSAAYRWGLQRRVAAFAAEVGGRVFPQDRPVVASIGYHLGRMVPPLTRYDHSPCEDEGLFLSEGFLKAYLLERRGALWRVLRVAARQSSLVVVAPPVLRRDAVSDHIAGVITASLRQAGVTVFDPREESDGLAEPLPDHLRAADGVHGTADYGAEVLRRLQARGLLSKA